MRRTLIVHNAYAMRVTRFELARSCGIDTQVLTIEQVAARLAGGFTEALTAPMLLRILDGVRIDGLGELSPVSTMPGFRRAVHTTLHKVFTAGIDLDARAKTAPSTAVRLRFEALAIVEKRILAALPPSCMTPLSMISAALRRVRYAQRLFGTIEVRGHTELDPVYRPLLIALAEQTELHWIAGPAHIPSWLEALPIPITRSSATTPVISVETCANARHEVLEGFRWARALIVDRGVPPGEIAIAAASCERWDDHVAALRKQSDLPLYAVHGERALHTADGQTAAALAELLLLGVSEKRIRRFAHLARYDDDADEALARRTHLCETLKLGIARASEIGTRLLAEPALQLWNQALLEGPPLALQTTLASLRKPPAVDDEVSPAFGVIWCSAAALASAPRPYVRLLGLTSRAWPRAAEEDALLPEHVIAQTELDPLPLHAADRRDFETIVAATLREVVCSRARRDSDGRRNGISPLWPIDLDPIHRNADRIPQHAASNSDRVTAQREEFAATPQAAAAGDAWNDRHDEELTAHDGVLPANHPVVRCAVDRVQSATSLALLLHDPLMYIWNYGFGWTYEDDDESPLKLDARLFGELLHAVLDRALQHGALHALQHLDIAVLAVADTWAQEHPLPPARVWQATLVNIAELARAALTDDMPQIPGDCRTEIAFGDSGEVVYLGESDIKIRGRIDRLDISTDGRFARVTDYKSGRAIPSAAARLIGGSELQRVMYTNAAKTLFPQIEDIESRLLFPRAAALGKPMSYVLTDVTGALTELLSYIATAKQLLQGGMALPFCGTDGSKVALDPEYAFAHPARAADWYFPRKYRVFSERLMPLIELWKAE